VPLDAVARRAGGVVGYDTLKNMVERKVKGKPAAVHRPVTEKKTSTT